MSSRSVYEELIGVRELIQDLDAAINSAAPSNAGIGGFSPVRLRAAVTTPALALLAEPRLQTIRNLDPDNAVLTGATQLLAVRPLLALATPANGLPPLVTTTPALVAYVHARLRDAVDGNARAIDSLQTVSSAFATPLGLRAVDQSVSSISAYPILTDDGSGGGSSRDPGQSATTGLQRTVDASVRDVIGRLPRYTDARAFATALAGSFAIADAAGVRTVSWRPRSYAGTGDLGGSVTGVQASVYARAIGARDAIGPLLAGLRPLRPDYDPQEVDAARSVVRAEIDALVEELGTEGGPRSGRVDQLFDVLFNQTTNGPTGLVGGGMLGYLGFAFGVADNTGAFTNAQVNTPEEEQEYSNYVLLVDHVRTVQTSWVGFQSQVNRDLGTQLYLLSRTLQVVAESVDEIEAALDSVFVGDAERAVIRFDTTASGEMLVAEFLSWVRSFAATEAPTLVAEGGRRGMGPIVDTATRLRALADDLTQEIASDNNLPDGLRHPRVRYPVQELRGYLTQVATLANRVI